MLRGSEHRRDDFLMDRGLMECPRRLEHHAEAPNGPLRGEEVLVLLTYMVSILLLVAGPSYLFQSHFSHPPWCVRNSSLYVMKGALHILLAHACCRSFMALQVPGQGRLRSALRPVLPRDCFSLLQPSVGRRGRHDPRGMIRIPSRVLPLCEIFLVLPKLRHSLTRFLSATVCTLLLRRSSRRSRASSC